MPEPGKPGFYPDRHDEGDVRINLSGLSHVESLTSPDGDQLYKRHILGYPDVGTSDCLSYL